MGISFKEALESGLVSSQTIKLLPSKCRCGSDMEFSNSLKEIRCSNKNCKVKLYNRVCKLCDKLGLDITYNEIANIVDKFALISPYQVMMLDGLYEENMISELDIHSIESIIQKIKNIKQSDKLLYEVVELCGIENISKIAKKIFNGFKSIDDAFTEIETGQLAFINERLGIKSQDSCIISLEIYNELISLKDELIFGETQFTIKNTDDIIYIAFADNVIPFVNKSELIEWLSYTYNYQFIQVTTVNDYTDILIKNANSISSKIRIARMINEKYVADAINNDTLSLGQINKFKDSELKPIGSKIYIDTLDNVIKRLDYMKGLNTNV